MAEKSSKNALGKFSSTPQIHWVAGLVVSLIVSGFLSLIAIAITNGWAQLVLLNVFLLLLAAAVGFAVRMTSSESTNQTFLAAFVTAGLGVHVVVYLAGTGYDDFDYLADYIVGAYSSAPFSAYVFFFGVVAALFATVGRRS